MRARSSRCRSKSTPAPTRRGSPPTGRAPSKRCRRRVPCVRQERHPRRNWRGQTAYLRRPEKEAGKDTIPKSAKRFRQYLLILAYPTRCWQTFRACCYTNPPTRSGLPANSAAPEGPRPNKAALDRSPLGALQKSANGHNVCILLMVTGRMRSPTAHRIRRRRSHTIQTRGRTCRWRGISGCVRCCDLPR